MTTTQHHPLTGLPTTTRNGRPIAADSDVRTIAALARRNDGLTWNEIASIGGYTSAATAENAVMRYVAYLNGNTPSARQTLARSANPLAFTRSFGIELEFKGIHMSAAARALEPVLGYLPNVTGYHQSGTVAPDFTTWHVERDGTVTDSRGYGGEVVSPILHGSEGLIIMREVTKALTEAGARVSVACGMHVHVDVRDLTGEQIARLIGAYVDRQTAFDQFVSPSRRGSRWCRNVASYEKTEWQDSFKMIASPPRNADRYKTVNVTSFSRTGTIEFRQHQGSLNGTKATAWIETLLAIVQAVIAVQDENLPADPLELVESLRPFGLTAGSARNMTRRIRPAA